MNVSSISKAVKNILKKPKKKYLKWIIAGIFAAVFFIFFFIFILRDLPSPTTLSSPQKLGQSTQILDRNGKLLYTVYTEKNRAPVALSELPKHVKEATIAIEDKDFYRHGPFDPRGIARALYKTVFERKLEGGSTITQQLVKVALLTPERTIQRKIKEFTLSLVVELVYDKDQILEMYLNHIPYGGTAYGIEAASQQFFGKPAKDLTVSEAALLASLPAAPTYYSPFGAYPERATARQNKVLKRMEEQGYISTQQREEAENENIKFASNKDSIKAPHFVFYIKDLLEKKYGEKQVSEGGLKVTTSLDLDIQEMAQATVSAEITKLKGVNVSNGAALVTNPGTGEILAMVGSTDYFDIKNDGNVNVTLSLRQPGSSIKPINYALGLLNDYSAATPFVDKKICFPNPGQENYCPVNYDGKFRGVVLMREALGSSINIPAIKMLKLNGVSQMLNLSNKMGIKSLTDPERYGLSLTLGGGEVTMLEMATAFGVFANQGYRIDPSPILKVEDSTGKVLDEYKPPESPIFGKKVLPESAAFIISHILSDNNARSLAFGPASSLVIRGQTVSVKTGTTNDFRDNWTIGYTPSFLVAAWVGNNDNRPMSGLVSGVTGAAPIWNKIMAKLLLGKKSESPKIPDSVVGIHVCATSGKLPPPEGTPNRCQTRFEYFIKGKEPKGVDDSTKQALVDKTTGDLAAPNQTDNVEQKDVLVVTDPTGDSWCLSCPHPELAQPSPTPSP